MKLRYLLFLFLLVPFMSVKADHLYNVKMEINIDKNGTANIIETWDVEADKGTEWYKQYMNLGKMEVLDFSVSMDGEPLKNKTWNVDETREEKAGFYGINKISDGIELCFGKKDFKRHTFVMTYKMTNFVFNTEDSQVLYVTLFPNFTADNFQVKVSSYYNFPDTLDVWGYGYKGYAYVKDGIIEMSNEGSLDEEYVVLLAKFPKETFEVTNSAESFTDFNNVLEKAKEGSFEYDYESKQTFFEKIISIIGGLIYPFIVFMFVLIGILTGKSNGYGYKNNKKIDKKDTHLFREIPCKKDIYYANTLINLNNFGYKESNILGAIILKWVKQKKITFINEEKGKFNKETSSIDLNKTNNFDNPLEEELFNLMRAASGDGILEAKELEKWCKKNYTKYLNLFEKLKNNEIDRLKNEGHIYKRTTKEECKYKNVMDDTLYKDSKELYGLKLFLEEFSSIDTKEVLEVHLWDEYLMFAYLFGIADKVAKQLKNLYPKEVKMYEEQGIDMSTIYYINHISASSVSAAERARAAAESYSSGGGGFSSGGGGGGSFGGGGSMGGR